MGIELQIYNSWLGGERIDGAKFLHNSSVEVGSGEYAGEVGSIVSLVQLGENARYVVETNSGQDIEVAENEIAHRAS
ncbi:Uncharacterised protein [Halioglobus japonicus]|jgi:hypothetical protein|nr:Uncharacterised protein [Halioglobus japonicus]